MDQTANDLKDKLKGTTRVYAESLTAQLRGFTRDLLASEYAKLIEWLCLHIRCQHQPPQSSTPEPPPSSGISGRITAWTGNHSKLAGRLIVLLLFWFIFSAIILAFQTGSHRTSQLSMIAPSLPAFSQIDSGVMMSGYIHSISIKSSPQGKADTYSFGTSPLQMRCTLLGITENASQATY